MRRPPALRDRSNSEEVSSVFHLVLKILKFFEIGSLKAHKKIKQILLLGSFQGRSINPCSFSSFWARRWWDRCASCACCWTLYCKFLSRFSRYIAERPVFWQNGRGSPNTEALSVLNSSAILGNQKVRPPSPRTATPSQVGLFFFPSFWGLQGPGQILYSSG